MKKTLNISLIEKFVCTQELIEPRDLHKRINGKLWKKDELKEARQIIIYFAMKNGYTQSKASAHFGLNHATAWHSRNVINNYLSTDKNFREKIVRYTEKLGKIGVINDRINYFKELLKPVEDEIKIYELRLNNLKTVLEDLKNEINQL